MSVYVVDTGEREVYVLAEDECTAVEQVAATGENVKHAEFYSDDPADMPDDPAYLPG